MMKVLLIIGAILLVPIVLGIVFSVAAALFKIALVVGVIALVVLGIKKLTESSNGRSYR